MTKTCSSKLRACIYALVMLVTLPRSLASCPSSYNLTRKNKMAVVSEKYSKDVCELAGATNDVMEKLCKEFCLLGEEPVGSTNYVLGAPGYGFDLAQMIDMFTTKGLLVNDDALLKQCWDWSDALTILTDKAANFAASAQIFTYHQLKLVTLSDNEVIKMFEELKKKSFSDTMKRKTFSSRMTYFKEFLRRTMVTKLRELMTEKAADFHMAVKDLEGNATDLLNTLSLRIQHLDEFLTKCNVEFLGTGPQQEQILDICPQSGLADCIDKPGARHVGCLCGVNPMAFPASLTIDGIGNISVTGGRRLGKGRKKPRRSSATAQATKKSKDPISRIEKAIEVAQSSGNKYVAAFRAGQELLWPDFFEVCGIEDPQRRLSALPAPSRTLAHRSLESADNCFSQTGNEGLKTVFAGGGNTLPKKSCQFRNPPITLANVHEQCSTFCSPGIPLIMGDPQYYGFNQAMMREVFIDKTMLAQDTQARCSKDLAVFKHIQIATAHFMKELEIFTAAQLLHEAIVADALANLKEYRTSKVFLEFVLDSRDPAGTYVTELKRKKAELMKRHSGLDAPKLAKTLENLRSSGHSLKNAINVNLPKLQDFVQNCNGLFQGIGGSNEYLLDLCGQQKADACIQEADAEHVGCICAINPLQFMGAANMHIQAKTTPSGRRLFIGDLVKGIGSTFNVIADAWTSSRPLVDKAWNVLHSIPGGPLIAETFLADMKYLYDVSYCAMKNARKGSASKSSSLHVSGLLMITAVLSQLIQHG